MRNPLLKLSGLLILLACLSVPSFATVKAVAQLDASTTTADAGNIYVSYNVAVLDTSQPLTANPVVYFNIIITLPDSNTASQNAAAIAAAIRSQSAAYGYTIPTNQLFTVLPTKQ